MLGWSCNKKGKIAIVSKSMETKKLQIPTDDVNYHIWQTILHVKTSRTSLWSEMQLPLHAIEDH
jgi:hypothetical protein